MRRTITTGILALSALVGAAMGEQGNSKHALDFLKMVEAQAREQQEAGRNLQVLQKLGSGALASAASNIAAGSVDGSSGGQQGAIGAASLITALANPKTTVGNVVGGTVDAALPDRNKQGDQAVAGPASTYAAPKGQPNAPGSATPGAAERLVSAPDTCGSRMTIDVESFAEYRIYVDGNQVGYSNGVQRNSFDTLYGSSGAITIAVEATRDKDMANFALVDGLHMNVSVCGQTFYSDQAWECTDTRPWTHTWRLSSYTPFNWMQAALMSDAETMVDGSKNFFIWSKRSCAATVPGHPESAFCRLKIKPGCPKHTPCYDEQYVSAPDTSCLAGCAMETAAMSKCAAMGYQINKKCGTCTPAYMAYYRQYCKTQGCSATQCDVPAEAPFVPNNKCVEESCASGLKGLKSQCEQQAYIFQSGCASKCGPETMAYARDQCLATYQCDPTQCSTFKEYAAENGGLADVPVGGGGGGDGDDGGGSNTPSYTPPPTPDMTCFFRCLSGMNRLSTYCEKIEYSLTSNCHSCPPEIIDWAKTACLDYQDPDGNKCTPNQCAAV